MKHQPCHELNVLIQIVDQCWLLIWRPDVGAARFLGRFHHELLWSHFFNSKEVALEGFAQDTFGKGGVHMFVVSLVWFWWKGDCVGEMLHNPHEEVALSTALIRTPLRLEKVAHNA